MDELSLDDVLLDEGDPDDALYVFNDIGLPLRIAALRHAADACPQSLTEISRALAHLARPLPYRDPT